MDFYKHLEKQLHRFDDWMKWIRQCKTPHNILLFGAGNTAKRIEKELLNQGFKIEACVVDEPYINDLPKTNCRHIITPEQMKQIKQTSILIIACWYPNLERITKICRECNIKMIEVDVSDFMLDINRTYIEDNQEQFEKVYQLFQDEKSRITYVSFLAAKLTRNIVHLKEIYVENQYFSQDIIQLNDQEVFVDGGAFDGDTFLEFQKNVKGGVL